MWFNTQSALFRTPIPPALLPIDLQKRNEKTNIMSRHDVIYVDAVTIFVHPTVVYLVTSQPITSKGVATREYKGYVPLTSTPSCFHRHSEYISGKKHFTGKLSHLISFPQIFNLNYKYSFYLAQGLHLA